MSDVSASKAAAGRPVLSFESVTVELGRRRILDSISFEVLPGQCWAILGPNGAGKSTLIRAAAQLLNPSNGRVETCGLGAGAPPRELARQVAWVPQHPSVSGEFTVLDIALMGRAAFLPPWGFPSRADEALAKEALAVLDVDTLAHRPIHTLSGGEARRVWLARALVQQPRLLLLDEPTAFLDLRHQLAALKVVKNSVQAGMAAAVVLHDLNLALHLATHVLMLKDGKTLARGELTTTLTSENATALYDCAVVKSADGLHFSAAWN